jgi:anti-sigma factor RsiW
MTDEADRLIAAALRDHARIPAPARLKRRLARRWLGTRPRWIVPLASALAGAALAASLLLVMRPAVTPAAPDVALEAVGDHQRVLASRGLGVISSDRHQVKPWFAGKLDFTPPVTFLGDDEFPLTGGDVAVFLGRRAAALVYARHLHVISLFVFEGAAPTSQRELRGFHVLTWQAGELGYALVSDVDWRELETLQARLR